MPLDAMNQELDPYSSQVIHAFDRVGPAVVHVVAFDKSGRPAGQGSGVIFTPDGYLLTNSHVVANATRLRASLTDGQSLEAALVGDDPATDTAVLRLSGSGVPHAELGASASLRVGQLVVAIGNPLGFTCTVTAGNRQCARSHLADRIGRTDRQRDSDGRPAQSGKLRRTFGVRFRSGDRYQHGDDAPAQGICFAIGIDTAIWVATRLMRDGRVRCSRLGLSAQTVPIATRVRRFHGFEQVSGVMVPTLRPTARVSRPGCRPATSWYPSMAFR